MTSRLSQRERLQSAADTIGEAQRAGTDAAAIVAMLVDKHGASHRCSPSGNTLRVAGVSTSCTWSKDQGLLDGWRHLATRQMLRLDGRSE